MSTSANHTSASARGDLILSLALNSLRACNENPSISKAAPEQARASSDITDCSMSDSTAQPAAAPFFRSKQMSQQHQQQQHQQHEQQHLQFLLQQRLQQQQEQSAPAEIRQPQPQQQQQQQQQLTASNASLMSSLLQRLASTYAAASASGATSTVATDINNFPIRRDVAPVRSGGGQFPPQNGNPRVGGNNSATLPEASGLAMSKQPAAAPDSNAILMSHLVRLVAASPAGRRLTQINASTENLPAFPAGAGSFASAGPFAAAFSPPARDPPATPSADDRCAEERPRASLRDFPDPMLRANLATAVALSPPAAAAAAVVASTAAAAAVATASSSPPAPSASAARRGTFSGGDFATRGGVLNAEERERDQDQRKRKFMQMAGREEGSFHGSEQAGEMLKSASTEDEGEGQGGWEHGEGDDDGETNGNKRKMRLNREQLAMLEDFFKKHPHLTPRQKTGLAKSLNVRVRQVEVWFQNRRARTKVKQTEVELEGLRRRCQLLGEENRRLKQQLAEREKEREDEGLKRSGDGEGNPKCRKGESGAKLPKCRSCQKLNQGENTKEVGSEEAGVSMFQFL